MKYEEAIAKPDIMSEYVATARRNSSLLGVSDSSAVSEFTFKDLKRTRPEVEFMKAKEVVSSK